MTRNFRHATAISIVLVLALLASVGASLTMVGAQTTNVATVIVAASDGGTTSPAPGTYEYNESQTIQLSAIPNSGFAFHYWVITGNVTPGHESPKTNIIVDPETGQEFNFTVPAVPTAADSLVITVSSLNITCGYGYTYEYTAVFTPISADHSPSPSTSPSTTQAVVIVAATTGGTTTPTPGTYVYTNESTIVLTATPTTGYAFHYWTITGNQTPGHEQGRPVYILDPVTNETILSYTIPPTPTPIDSLVVSQPSLNVTCGYGYTFEYTAVFTPAATPAPTTAAPTTAAPTTAAPTTAAPTAAPVDNTATYIVVAVVVIIIIIIIIAALVMRRKKPAA